MHTIFREKSPGSPCVFHLFFMIVCLCVSFVRWLQASPQHWSAWAATTTVVHQFIKCCSSFQCLSQVVVPVMSTVFSLGCSIFTALKLSLLFFPFECFLERRLTVSSRGNPQPLLTGLHPAWCLLCHHPLLPQNFQILLCSF